MPFGPGGKPIRGKKREPRILNKPYRKHQRSPAQMMKDMAVEAEMYLRGEPMKSIAAQIGVTDTQVYHDMKRIRAEWHASMIRDFDDHKAEELRKLDYLESEAYKAWQRSQRDEVSHEERTEDVPEVAIEVTERVKRRLEGHELLSDHASNHAYPKQRTLTVRTVGQYGDPRFLVIVRDCIAKRCEILGLNAAVAVTDDGFKHQADVRAIITQRLAQLARPAAAALPAAPDAGADPGSTGDPGNPPTPTTGSVQ